MGKWSKKFSKVLTAAGISAIVAVSSLAMPISASAARTVTDDVMIRNDASTDAGIIGSLNEGDEVEILDVLQSGDGYAWYYIQLENGATGYVRSDLIEADDSELAAFRDEVQEETQTEEVTEEAEEEEPAQEESEPETEAAPAQTETAAENTGAEGYDATKDPNASFRTGYEEEADGTVTWYVYNDDNGSKVKISDLQGQQTASESGGAGIWKPLAIIFGLLILGLAAFVLFLLKSIRDGRTKTTRGRALEAAAAAADEDDDDDEFYFDDDDEAEYDEDDTEAEEASDAETEESDEAEADEAAAEEDADQTVKASVTPDSTITMEVPEEVEPTEIPAEEIEAAIATETAQIEKNMAKDAEEAEQQVTEEVQEEVTVFAEVPSKDEEVADSFRETESEAEKFEDEEYENDDDEDYEDEGDDEDYDEEEYEDEDEEDEEYDEEDYDEDEDEESGSRAAKRSSSKGGFFGFLKKMFSSESEEDAEEGEDFDDYEDEPDEHEFDEFKEYPEDIDLLPREDEDDGDYLDEEEFSDDSTEETENERGRLSMQRVMKNVSYKEEEADFSQDDDLSDSLFDDDDDMEYSFISNRKK